jgi:hypothetical protein
LVSITFASSQKNAIVKTLQSFNALRGEKRASVTNFQKKKGGVLAMRIKNS